MASSANTHSQTPLVLLVSMERSAKRRTLAVAALKRLGLRYEWVQAVDGNELSDSEVNQINAEQQRGPMARQLSHGEIGCYLSHLKCYRLMRERKLPYALIMEDDMVPDEKLLTVLAQLDRFPPDWNIVNLAPSVGIHCRIDDKVVALHSPNLRHRTRLADGLFVGKYLWGIYHTHLYLLKAHLIPKLETHLRPIRLPIDEALFNLKFSPTFPYALYKFENERAFAWIYDVVGASEISSMGDRHTGGFGKHKDPPALNPKNLLRALISKTYFAFDGFLTRVMLNMRWRDTGKRNYIHNPYPPGLLRERIMVWRRCDWRDLPTAIIHAIRPPKH